jgi:hypothetical protein
LGSSIIDVSEKSGDFVSVFGGLTNLRHVSSMITGSDIARGRRPSANFWPSPFIGVAFEAISANVSAKKEQRMTTNGYA